MVSWFSEMAGLNAQIFYKPYVLMSHWSRKITAKSRFRGWGNRVTLMGGTAKGLHTYMKEENLQLL